MFALWTSEEESICCQEIAEIEEHRFEGKNKLHIKGGEFEGVYLNSVSQQNCTYCVE